MLSNTVKRRIVLFLSLILIPLCSIWAVWEGNAGIAAASEFPGSGLFARSDLFPRNTIVEVLNLEKDITVRVVVVGSSGVSGLIATLSPEAAQALNIRPGSVARVRISIPSLIAERSASARSSTEVPSAARDPDINPLLNLTYGSGIPLAVTASPAEDPLVPLSQLNGSPEAPAESLVEPLSTDPSDSATTAAVDSMEASQTAPLASTDTGPEITDDSTASPVAEQPYADVPMQDPVLSDNLFFDEPELFIAGEDEPDTDDAAETDTIAQEEVSSEPESETVAQQEVPAEPVVPVFTPVDEVALVPAENRPPQAVASPAAPVREIPPVKQPAPAMPAPVARIEEAPPSGTQPVAPKPEVAPIKELEPVSSPESKPVPSIAAVPELSSPEQKAPTENVQPTEPVAPIQPQASVQTQSLPGTASGLPFITTFERNSFYIQLAAYSDPVNVRRIVDTWGRQYPVCVERSAGRSGDVYKVFIGPVRRDESGAVLERFKQLGFPDAFVKRVP